MKSCKSNLSQVFTLFCDEENRFRALIESELDKQPLYDIPFQEDTYRVWRLSETALIEQLELFFQDKTLLIADGHHRYTTALHYKDFCRQQGAEIKSQSDYMMVFLSNLFDEGLVIDEKVLRILPFFPMIILWKFHFGIAELP